MVRRWWVGRGGGWWLGRAYHGGFEGDWFVHVDDFIEGDLGKIISYFWID